MSISSNLQEPTARPHNPTTLFSNHSTVLSKIYQDNINMTVWRRKLKQEVSIAAEHILREHPRLKTSQVVSPTNAVQRVRHNIDDSEIVAHLAYDICFLVKEFCVLFKVDETHLRLTALEETMCPRFHVDRLACRLLTTYRGKATEWLQHEYVDRSKLGLGNQGKPDNESGLFNSSSDIRKLLPGDIAIMKGENWLGNEGRGLVHRSPHLEDSANRLLLTLDFISKK